MYITYVLSFICFNITILFHLFTKDHITMSVQHYDRETDYFSYLLLIIVSCLFEPNKLLKKNCITKLIPTINRDQDFLP